MCGIAGIVMKEPVSPDRSLRKRMAESLRHRGPDDEGIEISGRVGFACAETLTVSRMPERCIVCRGLR